jgi:hypothetical protein
VRVASQEPDRVAKLLLTRKSDNLTRKKVIPMRPVTTKIVGKFQVTVPPKSARSSISKKAISRSGVSMKPLLKSV